MGVRYRDLPHLTLEAIEQKKKDLEHE